MLCSAPGAGSGRHSAFSFLSVTHGYHPLFPRIFCFSQFVVCVRENLNCQRMLSKASFWVHLVFTAKFKLFLSYSCLKKYINLSWSCIAQLCDAGTLILHQCPWRQVSGCSYRFLYSQLLKNILETHSKTEKLKLCPYLFLARLKWEREENWKRRLLQILYCLKIEGPAYSKAKNWSFLTEFG